MNAPTAGQDALDNAVRAEQVRVLYQTAPVGVCGALFSALLLAALIDYGGQAERLRLGLWLAAILLTGVAHLALCGVYLRCPPPPAEWRRWARRFVSVSLLEGVIWGAVWLWAPAALDQQMLVLLVAAIVSAGSVTAFGSFLPASFALMLPAMTGFLSWTVVQGDVLHRALGLGSLVFIATFVDLARRYNVNLRAAIRLRFDNQTLAENLTRQKAEVEAASLAKSRFLASASHDLRQPVHALGLFVGALRRTQLPPEAVELLDHIEASARGLDHLFATLLDISQLDAGVVEAAPRAFAVGPLIARLCREFRAEADARGLRLRYHATTLWVYADPLLTERILRNFLSNALRHTLHGGAVVGVRRGAGVASGPIRLVVSDTGPGIPAAMQEKIFEEFFQLGNPERDRRQGLGLGLAIARRLAALMNCPLTLTSVPGRGTSFSIALPATPPDKTVPVPVEVAASTGRFIVVIDDEADILIAMHELLTRWGHRVLTADSGDALIALLVHEAAVPDLIFADYRLRDGENGLDLVERLREEYNADIPALILTGDTAPERLREASARGHRLLHKPVRPYALERALTEALADPPAPPS